MHIFRICGQFQLLRRSAEYSIRRYPQSVHIETAYEDRNEALTALEAYISGKNSRNEKVSNFTPSLTCIRTKETLGTDKIKTMCWQIRHNDASGVGLNIGQLPAPTAQELNLRKYDEKIVAVLRFEDAVSEEIVRQCTHHLQRLVREDGLKPVAKDGVLVFAQYDAVFSLKQRRKEVWIELENFDV